MNVLQKSLLNLKLITLLQEPANTKLSNSKTHLSFTPSPSLHTLHLPLIVSNYKQLPPDQAAGQLQVTETICVGGLSCHLPGP